MQIKNIEVNDSTSTLSEVLTFVAAGNEVILTAGGTHIARVLPTEVIPKTKLRTPDLHPGAIETSEDFDAPLPDGFSVT